MQNFEQNNKDYKTEQPLTFHSVNPLLSAMGVGVKPATKF